MHDNKLYKILRIVFLTLAILSLVFTLAKKVGLCAADSNTVISSLPFPVGSGYGNNYSVAELNTIMSVIEHDMEVANDPDYTSIGVVIAGEIDSTYSRFRVFSSPDCITVTNPLDAFTTGSVVSYNWGSSSYAGCREVILNTSDLSYYEGYWVTSYQPSFNTSTWLSESPTGSFYLSSGLLSGYPLYIFEDIYINSTLFFSESPLSSDTAHTKGGVIDDYSDSYDLIDNDTSLPDVDNSAPADPSSNASWFQKFLDAFKKINQSVKSGFVTITYSIISALSDLRDFIGRLIEDFMDLISAGFQALFDLIGNVISSIGSAASSIVSKVGDVIDSIGDVIDSIGDGLSDSWDFFENLFHKLLDIFEWFYEHGEDSDHQFDFMILFHYLFDFDTEAALDAFEENKYGDFILDIRDFCSTVYNSITGATASERVFFTISLGDHFGTHFQDITINFDWYANVRDTFLPYLMAFIYVSAIWLFIKRLPDIIHGAASAESSFTDALPEHAEVKHGLFTHGVSHNQPSLDKSPLSGGGGVHSGSSQFWY